MLVPIRISLCNGFQTVLVLRTEKFQSRMQLCQTDMASQNGEETPGCLIVYRDSDKCFLEGNPLSNDGWGHARFCGVRETWSVRGSWNT